MTARHTHPEPAAHESPALALESISKRFGTVEALTSASLVVRPGTVHALLGENGAGKSTLMHIAYGMVRPDRGTVTVQGLAEHFVGARGAIAHHIGMVHQHFTLVPVMTVAENIALGGRGRLDAARIAERVREIAERTGFALDPAARVESLTVGAQQRVEIAKALVRDARVLILDEPTAVLAPAETAELLRWIRAFADRGNAVVLITHKLQEALSVADDVTVLRLGRTVLTARADAVTRESLTAAMLGADHAAVDVDDHVRASARAVSSDAPVFRADRVSVVDAGGVTRVRDASFAVHAGEIVGIAGIEGSGQRELLRVLAGRMQPSSGTLSRPTNVGFVPEDRHHDGVLLERDLAENVALRGAGTRHGSIDWHAWRAHAATLMREFDVRAEHPRVPMRTLSGGNQQKLVLARELQRGAAASTSRHEQLAIVAENPTRGLDVRATADVHARLRAACAEGAAIVLYSSDLDEVLLLATRVLVAYDGTVRETAPDRDAIGRAMLGLP